MPTCDLVLQGGGVKGIALVGAWQVLEEHGYTVSRVAGASAGGIVGSLVAAGIPAAEMVRTLRSLDYRSLLDHGWEDDIPLIGTPLSLALDAGIYEGDALRAWIADLLAEHGVHTFADLRLADPDSALPPERRYRLLLMASDISAQRLRVLPWDFGKLGLPADQQAVAGAVRASASIPGFFEPVDLPRPGGGHTRLVDGGLLSNFPVWVFDRPPGERPRWPTFGVRLSGGSGTADDPDVTGPIDTLKAIVGTLLNFFDGMRVDDPAVQARTIVVDSLGVGTTDFRLGPDTVEALYQSGRDAATRFLASWDFDTYVARFRPSAGDPA